MSKLWRLSVLPVVNKVETAAGAGVVVMLKLALPQACRKLRSYTKNCSIVMATNRFLINKTFQLPLESLADITSTHFEGNRYMTLIPSRVLADYFWFDPKMTMKVSWPMSSNK